MHFRANVDFIELGSDLDHQVLTWSIHYTHQSTVLVQSAHSIFLLSWHQFCQLFSLKKMFHLNIHTF